MHTMCTACADVYNVYIVYIMNNKLVYTISTTPTTVEKLKEQRGVTSSQRKIQNKQH